jgi:hypothetical protein
MRTFIFWTVFALVAASLYVSFSAAFWGIRETPIYLFGNLLSYQAAAIVRFPVILIACIWTLTASIALFILIKKGIMRTKQSIANYIRIALSEYELSN